MQNTIQSLLELQAVHLELDSTREVLNQVPDRLREINEQFERAQEECASVEAEAEELENELVRLKTENEEESERVRNYDKRLKQLKTNREYQALLREIGFSRRLVAETDEEMKVKNVSLEEAKERLEELKLALNTLNEEREALDKDWSASQSDMRKQSEALEKKEKELSHKVPRDIIGRYNLVRQRASVAVVAAENYKCTGCHMSIPPQLFNRLLRGAELLSCPSCSRIMFIDRSESAEEAETEA